MIIEPKLDSAQLKKLERRLEAFAEKLKRPTEANRRASVQLYAFVINNFRQQGRLQRVPWAPLAPTTVRAKKKLGKTVPLVRSGHLRSGFVPFYSASNAGVGNEVIYARTHEEGRGGIPARKMLPDRDTTLQIGLKVYGVYVQSAAREANR